jgi:hypothetical protein
MTIFGTWGGSAVTAIIATNAIVDIFYGSVGGV